MSDITPPNPDPNSISTPNPGNPTDCSEPRTGGVLVSALDGDGEGSGEGIGGDSTGTGHRAEQHMGSTADEPIYCAGAIIAPVNHASQTVLVNIHPSNSSTRPRRLKLMVTSSYHLYWFEDSPDSEHLHMNIVVSWRYMMYISGLFFVSVLAACIPLDETDHSNLPDMYGYDRAKKPYNRRDKKQGYPQSGMHKPKRGRSSEQEIAGKNHKILLLEDLMHPTSLGFSPQVCLQIASDFAIRVTNGLNISPTKKMDICSTILLPGKWSEQRNQVQCGQLSQLPYAMSFIPLIPSKLWGTDKSTGDRCVDQQKQPPPIHKDKPVAHPLPLLLCRRYNSREESPPLERRLHPAYPSDEGAQLFKIQDKSSHTDNKDRLLTVWDMEHFTKAIQDTIREMGSEFVEALAEMHRPEDYLDDYEDEPPSQSSSMSPNELSPQTTLEGHTAAITAVEFSPDGRFLASAGDDGIVLIFSTSSWTPHPGMASKKPLPAFLWLSKQGSAHFDNVKIDGTSPPPHLQGSTTVDNRNALIWDPHTIAIVGEIIPRTFPISNSVIAADDNIMAVSNLINGVDWYSLSDLAFLSTTKLPAGAVFNPSSALTYFENGTSVVLGSADRSAYILSCDKGVKNVKNDSTSLPLHYATLTRLVEGSGVIQSVAFAPTVQGQALIATGTGGLRGRATVTIWAYTEKKAKPGISFAMI
ncbi:hypothetical protein BDM02DRAFT_3132050 [Thelephora ganbajun]|uniref:Uncharacterized protein n=1 Tax=Thelephora ganbajun TaxID=370292 RepID=A0ACB6Z3K4_THEGA|nr:hypothetical protein BDM02DRAFT_3132050 [Thelephora ganbajun]